MTGPVRLGTVVDDLACKHLRSEVRRKVAVNGMWMVGAQCLDCGHAAGKWLAKKDWPQDLGEWDYELADRRSRQSSEAFGRAREAKRQAEKEEWFDEHNVYLKSEAWQSLRRRVSERAGGLCEGCRLRPGAHAHHLTYDHWRNELLFELVWVCEECHEKAHGRFLDEDPR